MPMATTVLRIVAAFVCVACVSRCVNGRAVGLGQEGAAHRIPFESPPVSPGHSCRANPFLVLFHPPAYCNWGTFLHQTARPRPPGGSSKTSPCQIQPAYLPPLAHDHLSCLPTNPGQGLRVRSPSRSGVVGDLGKTGFFDDPFGGVAAVGFRPARRSPPLLFSSASRAQLQRR